VSYDVKAVAMNLGGRWWYFPGDSIESILWEVTWRDSVPCLHECTGNIVRGIAVEEVVVGRPLPLEIKAINIHESDDLEGEREPKK
jgi:hypothetical protein